MRVIKSLFKFFWWIIKVIYCTIPFRGLGFFIKKTWRFKILRPVSFLSILILVCYCCFVLFYTVFLGLHVTFYVFADGYLVGASYFGKNFFGRKTADLTVYTRESKLVASRFYPLEFRDDETLKYEKNPNHIPLIIIYNDRKLTDVPVKDRGPFRESNFENKMDGFVSIDLSYSLARELGITKKGIDWIKIKARTLKPFYKFRTYRQNDGGLKYYTRNLTWQVKVINFFLFKPWVVFNPWFEKKVKESEGKGVEVWIPYNFYFHWLKKPHLN